MKSSGSLRVDASLAVLLLLAGALAGSAYFRTVITSGGSPWFYQVDFGPAVMQACGHGFKVPDDTQLPSLAAFLQSRTDTFACSDLPAAPPLRPLAGAQPWLAWANLLRSAGIIWSWSGVSWSGLAPLAGLFLGSTLALAFVLLRLVCGPLLAAAGVLFWLTSPLLLIQLPQFRDFSKVPFMLALAWVLAQLLAPSVTARRLLVLAAIYGVVLGVGVGFRNDPLITIPPFAMLVLLARSDASWRRRAGILALAAAVCVVAASPVINAFRQGGGAFMSHAALLGMMRPIDESLGIAPPTLHEVGYGVTDTYAAAVISASATRRAGRPEVILGHSPAYDSASSAYLLRVAATLPADLIARGYAATARVSTLPSWLLDPERPPQLTNPAAARFYGRRARVLRAFAWVWPAAIAGAFVLAAASRFRVAVILWVLFIYFTASAAVQFHVRHIIHLELIPIAALMFVAQRILSRQWHGSWRQAAGFLAGAIVVIAAPLLATRAYQQRSLASLVNEYLAAPAVALDLTPTPTAGGRVLLEDRSGESAAWTERHQDAVLTEFLIVELAGGTCGSQTVDITIRYAGTVEAADFARRFEVSPPSQPGDVARVLVAAYAYKQSAASGGATWYRFQGFELAPEIVPCLTRVLRLSRPEQFPVVLGATLPPDWHDRALFAKVRGW